MQEEICPICQETHQKLSRHYASKHKAALQKQEQTIVALWRAGQTARQIASIPHIIYKSNASITRVLRKHVSSEELEAARVVRLAATLKDDYASGKYDHIKEAQAAKNKEESSRAKNSEGLKRAYASGDRVSWNDGETKRTGVIEIARFCSKLWM